MIMRTHKPSDAFFLLDGNSFQADFVPDAFVPLNFFPFQSLTDVSPNGLP